MSDGCAHCGHPSVALYLMEGKDMDGHDIKIETKLCAKHRRVVDKENEAAKLRSQGKTL